MHLNPSITVVIPAYNEEPRLAGTLDLLSRFSPRQGNITEIIVVDDGSRDMTPQIARRAAAADSRIRLVSYWPNAGKGYAVRRGVLEAHGDLLLITDADLSTPPEELDTLLDNLEPDTGIVIGSRGLDERSVQRPQAWYRQRMGKIFNRLMRSITRLPYADTQCGFKLLRRDIGRELFSLAVIDRFAWDVELLMLAHRRGVAVREVPVRWFDSPGSRVHIVRDSCRMLIDVVRIRWRLGAL